MRPVLSVLALCITSTAALAQLPCFDTNLGRQLALSDDSFSGVEALGFPFAFGGVTYTDVQVCSNGFIVLGSGTPGQADYSPSVGELIGNPQARIALLWRDLNPSSSGSGKVWVNSVPASGSNPAYFSVTYDGVYQYSTSTPVTCQLLLIEGGLVQMHHGADTALATNSWLVGSSPGNGAAANPVAFSGLPVPVISNGATLHEDGSSGCPLAGRTMLWSPTSPGYVVVPAGGCASWSTYGEGCLQRYGSFYELFDLPGTPNDLSGTSFLMVNTGNGYVTVPAATPRRGIANATNLNLSDDQEVVVPFATGLTTMPVPGGVVNGLAVCSNGIVSTGPNTTAYTPTVARFLALPNTAWAVGWHDLLPANGTRGAGGVYVEETATHFYVIYDQVQSLGGSSGAGNTMELHFDKAAGTVEVLIVSVDNLGNDYLVGFTVGGVTLDPGSEDLSAATFLSTGSPESLPLALAADGPPIVTAGMSLVTSNITPNAVLGGLLFGARRFDPGIDLSGSGMPGCFQFNDQVAVRLFYPSGASTVAVPIVVPNAPGFAIQVQSAVYDPTAALNAVNSVASNGVELQLGY
ncbi:MAG: hypothetical protein NXI31_09870 [bacterium]|nr:hypothetical protein [bacterium]